MTGLKVDLSSLRKAKQMSQSMLAEKVGVSQATISRIEKGEYDPDLRLAAKIARAVGIGVRELVPDGGMVWGPGSPEDFYAFCQNPFCERNEIRDEGGEKCVYWRSGQTYPAERFGEVNFCPRCGEDLAKECPGCGRRLEQTGTKFCITCGAPISSRPTDEDWKRIRGDDDVPF